MIERLKYCFAVLALLLAHSVVAQVPFQCKGQYYVSLSPELHFSSNLFEVKIDPNSNLAFFDPVKINIGKNLNAMGYRSTDNLIYGVDPDEFFLYQVDANGDVVELKRLNLTLNNEYFAGDVSPDGRYLILIGGGVSTGMDNEIVKVDLESPNYNFTRTGFSAGTRIFDIAFDPEDGKLYGFDSRRKQLVEINPDTGQIITAFPQQNLVNSIGALFFDTFGNLFAYGGTVDEQEQDKLFAINKRTGQTVVRTTGPVTEGNDGCSCPYTIKLEKTVSPKQTLPCETVQYTFTIANRSGIPRVGIDLIDVLPLGLEFVSVIRNPYGGDSSTSSGSNISIYDMTIPPGIDSIVVSVYVNDIPAGIYRNQATLLDLPESLGSYTLSDNPDTFIKEDSTNLIVNEFTLEFIEEFYGKCEGEDLIIDATIPGVDILWEDGSTEPNRVIDGPGTYTLTATNNCRTLSKTISVQEEYIEIDVDQYEFEVELGDRIEHLASISTNALTTNITWQNNHPKNIYDCEGCLENSMIPLFNSTTTVLATTGAGCSDSVDIKIRVKKIRKVFAPNIFSPNGDGINDLFFLQGLDNVMVNRFEIFDRWGNNIYSSSSSALGEANMAWKGSYGGSTVNPGVYVWYAEVEWLDGYIEYLAGDVTVVR